jgi:hypothetical protein
MSLKNRENMKIFLIIFFILIVIFISASIALSHGGKHKPGEFSNLQALKKATELYDQLIGKGKLDQSWENKLSQVDVFKREKDDKSEIVVSFQRESGEPKTVYIFLNADGKYSGSNFTGD